MANYSISAYGVERCSGFCSYCSCASTINYEMGCKKDVKHLEEIDNYVFEKQYKADWNKVKETLLNDPQIKGKTKEQLSKEHVHFDLWGGDPVTNLKMVKDMIENLTKICQDIGFRDWSFSDSTNGMAFIRNEIVDWHLQNNVHIQLSHDGIGQFIRTRDIDPLDYDNTKLLFKEGILSAVNTTLSFYNPDMVKNFNFWTNYLKGIFPNVYSKDKMASQKESAVFENLYIKLNHIYNGTDYKKQKNVMGMWNGKVYEQLKGEELGNFNLINDHERAEKYGIPEMAHVLDDYLHSYKMLIPMMGKMEFIPFYNYVSEQLKRYKILPDENTIHAACRAFQRYQHNIGEERSQKPTTFVIDTMGNYTECNLLYSKYSVKNPGGVQAPYCKTCKYRYASECLPCGAENFPERCHYQYPWLQFLEEVRAGIYNVPKKFNKNISFDEATRLLKNHWTPEMKKAMEEMHKRGL